MLFCNAKENLFSLLVCFSVFVCLCVCVFVGGLWGGGGGGGFIFWVVGG